MYDTLYNLTHTHTIIVHWNANKSINQSITLFKTVVIFKHYFNRVHNTHTQTLSMILETLFNHPIPFLSISFHSCESKSNSCSESMYLMKWQLLWLSIYAFHKPFIPHMKCMASVFCSVTLNYFAMLTFNCKFGKDDWNENGWVASLTI